MSPYSQRQTLALFMEDSANYRGQKRVLRFVVNIFIVVGLLLPYLNTPIIKV